MKIAGKNLNLEKSIGILKKYKIPVAKSGLAKSVYQAVNIAKLLGYPVALKAVSSSISHKTDVGGVVLDLNNENELKEAHKGMVKNLRKRFGHIKIEGILVQRMVKSGQEVIIGGRKDEQFGHVIMFGLGGIFTEIFNDVSFRVTPITKDDAKSMIKETKGYKILEGYRDKKYNIKSLVEILLKVSKLLKENPKIKEMDINPLILLPRSAVAVDVRITID